MRFFKSTLILFFTLFIGSTICFSQDKIVVKSSVDIDAKILEITTNEVKYKKSDNLNGPTYSILKSKVISIKYENGTVDVFTNAERVEGDAQVIQFEPGTDYFLKGQKDSKNNYRGYQTAGTVTLITSFLFPIAGLIPAIACSATPPKEKNLDFPRADLTKNQDYMNGYKQQSRRTKQAKVWTNFGIGAVVGTLVGIVLAGG